MCFVTGMKVAVETRESQRPNTGQELAAEEQQ